MSIGQTAFLIEQAKVECLLAPQVPSSAVPLYVCLAGYERACIIITQHNGTAPVGSVISLEQATAVANTSGKAAPITRAWSCLNTGPNGNSDALTAITVVSNTFTTDNTANTDDMYAIEILNTDLDINNGFDCIRLNVGNTTNATVGVVGILYPAKFGGATPASAIVNL